MAFMWDTITSIPLAVHAASAVAALGLTAIAAAGWWCWRQFDAE